VEVSEAKITVFTNSRGYKSLLTVKLEQIGTLGAAFACMSLQNKKTPIEAFKYLL